MQSPKYIIKSEFYINNYFWEEISKNPGAIDIIQYELKDAFVNNRPTYIDWTSLSKNNNATHIFIDKKYKKYINWHYMSLNDGEFSYELIMEKYNNNNILTSICDKLKYWYKLITCKYFIHDYNEISWYFLSANKNPKFISLINNNMDKIDWTMLSMNPNAISILENNQDKIDWEYLAYNINAINLLKNNINKIDWFVISQNENAIDIIKDNLNKIDIVSLCDNTNKEVFEIINNKINAQDFNDFNENHIFVGIKWFALSRNPNAIELLKKHPNKVHLEEICYNPNAIDIIKDNINYIDEMNLIKNTNPEILRLVIPYDYAKMKDTMQQLFIELNEYILHPTRLHKLFFI